jgi:vacuolar-type H+-ATPase subunit I/STV1
MNQQEKDELKYSYSFKTKKEPVKANVVELHRSHSRERSPSKLTKASLNTIVSPTKSPLRMDYERTLANVETHLTGKFQKMNLFNTSPSPDDQSIRSYIQPQFSPRKSSFENLSKSYSTSIPSARESTKSSNASSYFPTNIDTASSRENKLDEYINRYGSSSSAIYKRTVESSNDHVNKHIESPFEKYRSDNARLNTELSDTHSSKLRLLAQYQTEKQEWIDKFGSLEEQLRKTKKEVEERDNNVEKQKSILLKVSKNYEEKLERFEICVVYLYKQLENRNR